MDERDVRDYIIETHREATPPLVSRELSIRPGTSLINTIIGPRRAGKTYFLYQLRKLSGNMRTLYLNFEDTRLLTVSFKDFHKLVELYIEIFGAQPEQIFFDEPQNVLQWERGVRSISDRKKYSIVITGSSSKMLSSEISTHLRGRSITHLLLPFSFREFLAGVKAVVPKVISSSDAAVIKGQLKKWLMFGGYPEVVKATEKAEKIKILKSYKETMIYRDIIERHRIKEPFMVKLMMEHLISGFSKDFSVNSFFRLLKSRNMAVSKKTLYSYLSFIEDSLGVFLLEKWSPKLKESRLSPKKAYLCDNGLAYMHNEEISRLMENSVFLELKRRQDLNPSTGLHYWKDYSQREVDFVITDGMMATELIQVTYAYAAEDVRKRETSALIAASKELKCSNMLVITWDYECVQKRKKGQIVFVPLWKWLLGMTKKPEKRR
jgi:predicted AAA+ superfamily ATPase